MWLGMSDRMRKELVVLTWAGGGSVVQVPHKFCYLMMSSSRILKGGVFFRASVV